MRLCRDEEELKKWKKLTDHCELKDEEFITNLFGRDLSEVFSYFVEGAIKYYANGKILTPPKVVLDYSDTTRSHNDPVQRFLDECCDICDYPQDWHIAYEQGAYTTHADLYNAYMMWWSNLPNKRGKVENRNEFSQNLISKGYNNCRKKLKGKKTPALYFQIIMKPLNCIALDITPS